MRRRIRWGVWKVSLGRKFPTIFCIVPNEKAVKRAGKLIRANHSSVKYMIKSWQKLTEEDAFENWYIPHIERFSERWLPEQLDI